MQMDEKLNRDGMNNVRGIRTLMTVDGKFESMGIDSSSQNLQSCSNVEESGRDATGDASFSSYLLNAEEFCARRSSSSSGRKVEMGRNSGEGVFPIVKSRLSGNKSTGIESHRGGVAKTKHKAGDSCTLVDGGVGTVPLTAKAGSIQGDKSQSNGMQRPARLDRQASLGQRVGVVGRHGKDGEIGVFDAEGYFSNMHDEHKSSPRLVGGSSRREGNNRTRSQITIGLVSDSTAVSDVGATISRQPSSAASSLGSKSMQCDSHISWNSQSVLLSNGVPSFLNGPPLNQRLGNAPKIGAARWKLSCRCPCTNKKSVATNDSLLCQTPRIVSAPASSLQSSHASSPLRPNWNGITSNNFDNMSRSYCSREENRELSIIKDSYFANRSLSLRAAIHKDEQMEMTSHAKPRVGKSLIEIRPTPTAREDDGIPVFNRKNQGEGFSFPDIVSSSMSSVVFNFPKEKPGLSLQVIESRSSRDSQKQSLNVQGRQIMYSTDSKADNTSETRSSFSFPRVSSCSQDSFDDNDLVSSENAGGYKEYAMKVDDPLTVEDDKSDSSSDLFEIESLSTDIVPCTQYHRSTNTGRTQFTDCKQNSGQRSSSRISGDWSISSREIQEQKHFMCSVEMARRSDGYISRPIVRDNLRELSKPTRTTMLLESFRNNRAAHISSAPGSPTRGTQL